MWLKHHKYTEIILPGWWFKMVEKKRIESLGFGLNGSSIKNGLDQKELEVVVNHHWFNGQNG